MRFDKLTQKAQEAILEAQGLAERMQHPAVEPEHLLQALVVQDGRCCALDFEAHWRGFGDVAAGD